MSSNSSSVSGTMNSTAASEPKKVARKSTKTEVAPAPAPVAVVAATPAPAATETKKAPRKSTKTEATPAPAPVVAAPVATVEATTEAPTQTVGDEIKGMISSLNGLREVISTLHAQLKKLDKRVHREIKDARKRRRRTAPAVDANGEAKPARLSIFEIPTRLSDDLCAFLGKAKGSEMSRSNVTKAVTTYIKEKGLKNKHDIKPDASLKKLLAVPEGEALTYFNLQKYLNKHYVKTEKVVAH